MGDALDARLKIVGVDVDSQVPAFVVVHLTPQQGREAIYGDILTITKDQVLTYLSPGDLRDLGMWDEAIKLAAALVGR